MAELPGLPADDVVDEDELITVNHVTDRDRDHGRAKMLEIINTEGIGNQAGEIPIVVLGRADSDRNSNSAGLKQSSIDRYTSYWNMCYLFCLMAGLYEDGIIFDRAICPNRPPTVSVLTLQLILMYFCHEAKSILKYPNSDRPVLSKLLGHRNEVIRCCGTWAKSNTIDGLKSAVSYLHKAYARTSVVYEEKCQDCIALYNSDAHTMGCCDHFGLPLLVRKGNPALNASFCSFFNFKKEVAEEVSPARTNLQLLPHELRLIRTELLSRNKIFDLMMWTILIVGIKGFLRAEEDLTLKINSFDRQYFQLLADRITQLCMSIRGKTERAKASLLRIVDDPHCPEFSSLRALLLWINVTGIKDGPIFPTRAELNRIMKDKAEGRPFVPAKGNLSYVCFKECLTKLLKLDRFNIFPKRPDGGILGDVIIGTHVMRKTGYLISAWGYKLANGHASENNIQCNLMGSARHLDSRTAAAYLDDAPAMQEVLEAYPELDNRVGPWVSIMIKDRVKIQRRMLAKRNVQSDKTLPEIADWFIHELCSIPHDTQDSFFALSERINGFNPAATPRGVVQEMIMQEVEPIKRGRWMQVIDEYAAWFAGNGGHQESTEHTVAVPGPIQENVMEQARPVGTQAMELPVETTAAAGESQAVALMIANAAAAVGTQAVELPVETIAAAGETQAVASTIANAAVAVGTQATALPVETMAATGETAVQNEIDIPFAPPEMVSDKASWPLGYDYCMMIREAPDKLIQVQLCVDAAKHIDSELVNGKTLNDSLRGFMYRVGKIPLCLKDCYHGCIPDLLEANSEFNISKYVCPKGQEHKISIRKRKRQQLP